MNYWVILISFVVIFNIIYVFRDIKKRAKENIDKSSEKLVDSTLQIYGADLTGV